MKRIYNSDVRISTDGMNLPELPNLFTFKFYTVDENVCITKTQSDVDGEGYINLDWSLLRLLGEGGMSYSLTKRIVDPAYPDGYYDTTDTRLTNYFIVTDVQPIPPAESASTLEIIINLIEEFEGNMQDALQDEASDRAAADQVLAESVSGLTGRVEDLENRDFSGFATKVELESGVTDAKTYAAERDTVVLNSAKTYTDTKTQGMATQGWVEQQGYLTQHQDLTNYLTRSDYNRDQVHMASKDWTQTYVQQQIEGGIDLSNYYTKEETQEYVQEAIEGGVDLSNYYKKAETDEKIAEASGNTITWVVNQHYLTEHQSLDGYATEDWVNEQGFLKEHQSLDDYYTSGQTDTAIAAASSNTVQWVENQHYLTEHQDLSSYAEKTDVVSAVTATSGETIDWVKEQNYLTEHQSLDNYAQKNDVVSAVTTVSGETIDWVKAQDYAAASDIPDVSDYFDDAQYDSDTKRINFYHGNTVKAYIDATAFIKDGMVENVEIKNGNLVITFNTDAGQEPISIPLTDIFNPANYLTSGDTMTAVNTASGNTIQWVVNQNYLTQHQSLEGYATEQWVQQQGYLTEHQSLADYYTSAQTQAAITTASGQTVDWVKEQGYLTEHQSLADYARKDDVTSAVTTVSGETIDWVKGQQYLTTETEPDFNASVAKDITSEDITNWNGKSDFSGAYNDLTGKPDLSIYATSADTADMATKTWVGQQGYLTTETEPAFNGSVSSAITASDITNWNGKSDFSGSYNDLTDKPTIPTVPTNVSDFNNDAHYITSADTVSTANSATTATSAITATSAVTATSANSVPSGVTGFDGSYVIRVMTTDQYSAITPDINTIYIIKDN